jgi:hypothetical protein
MSTTPFRPELEPLGDRITPSHMGTGMTPPVNQGMLISALNHGPAQLADLNGLTNLMSSGVSLVNVADVIHGFPAFDNALERNMASVTSLQDLLKNSTSAAVTILNQALSTGNVMLSSVVALDVLRGGNVILFHQ